MLSLGKHECFTWRLPDHVTPGPCEITVSGRDDDDEDGYMFTDSKEVQVVDTHQITFIQTDRPVYRPGDIGECFEKEGVICVACQLSLSSGYGLKVNNFV